MSHCDRCGAFRNRWELARTEGATIDKHGDPQEGLLCRDCWPDDWEWPHDNRPRVQTGP